MSERYNWVIHTLTYTVDAGCLPVVIVIVVVVVVAVVAIVLLAYVFGFVLAVLVIAHSANRVWQC